MSSGERSADQFPDPVSPDAREKAAELYNFYLDTPFQMLTLGSEEQQQAFTALAAAVKSEYRARCPDRTLLLEASARVREVWSAADRFQGGTLDVLLEAADLLAQGTTEEERR